MLTQQQFYKTKKWETFRKIIIDQRTGSDGFVRCAECGKPIIKPYDLIVHHVEELDDVKANDANIALNPDNVVCVHFRCHNKIHERFGYNRPGDKKQQPRKVYIVYGPPCSGKTTWVNAVVGKGDLIVDIDNLWQAVTNKDRYCKPKELNSIVLGLRDKLYDDIKYRAGKWTNAYVIASVPTVGDRERLVKRVSADECILIDETKEVCLDRADGERPMAYIQYIVDWFNKFQE